VTLRLEGGSDLGVSNMRGEHKLMCILESLRGEQVPTGVRKSLLAPFPPVDCTAIFMLPAMHPSKTSVTQCDFIKYARGMSLCLEWFNFS
jgi:hypothetical protein